MTNAGELLEVAEDLLGGETEAHWRSAVSRAYYATFHQARALFRQCRFAVPQSEKSHAYLWQRLSNCGHPDLAHTGAELNDLRSQRNWADYDLDRALEQTNAADYVQSARNALEVLEQAATMPTVLSSITNAIRVYERDVLKQVSWD